MNCAI